jgi:hypothetical protein
LLDMGSSGVTKIELQRKFEEFKQQDVTRQLLAEVSALGPSNPRDESAREWRLPLASMNGPLPAPSSL